MGFILVCYKGWAESDASIDFVSFGNFYKWLGETFLVDFIVHSIFDIVIRKSKKVWTDSICIRVFKVIKIGRGLCRI